MIGNVAVGGGETIKIQSMSTFKISDVDRAVSQCALLKEAGLDIMRFPLKQKAVRCVQFFFC